MARAGASVLYFGAMTLSPDRPFPPWVCPTHGQVLIEAESLGCPSGCEYPIVNQIPRFVGRSSYADAFGVQWRTFRRTQLDSYTGLGLSTKRARRCLGESLWNSLGGQTVLECGCGA